MSLSGDRLIFLEGSLHASVYRIHSDVNRIDPWMLARRLNGRYLAPHCEHLDVRVQEIQDGKYEKLIEDLMGKPLAEIQELYYNRDIEK